MSNRANLVLVLACFTAANSAAPLNAQDQPCGTDSRASNGGGAHLGPTTSPFEPPEANDRTFVINSGSGLDTGCTFRSGGPLLIQLPITRFVNEVDANGNLVDVAGLIAAGLVSAEARLIMPAFDIDNLAVVTPPDQPEIDRVSINGIELGFLSGENGTWKLNSFQVPIELLKFPTRAAPGTAPTPAMNEIQIDIDIGNAPSGEELWCMEIDWAALSLKAMSPVILIHGNNSNGGFWDRQGFTTTLTQGRIPFDNSISMMTAPVGANAAALRSLIPAIVQSFGVDSVHIVCHSKGGLDTRMYLQYFHPEMPFDVLSMSTCSSPHNGSSGADVLVSYALAATQADEVEFQGFPSFTHTLASQLGVDAGTPNLTPRFAAAFNATNVPALPTDIVYNTVGGDADVNNTSTIDIEAELAALRIESPDLASKSTFVATAIIDRIYQILRNTTSVSIRYEVRPGFFWGSTRVAVLTSVPNPTPLGNDTLVTIPSAMGVGGFGTLVTNTSSFSGAAGRNHSNIADAGVASTILPWILATERANGDLR